MEKKIDWQRPEIFTVIITFITGLFVHLFGLVNVLQNYDSIIVQPYGYGIALHSGRWSLLLLGHGVHTLLGAYNLHWVNGILFILFVAITAGFVVSVFDMKCSKSAALIGIIFITFPSAASTLFFKYTAHYDAFALLLAVLAVWFLEKYKYGLIPAALSIAFSLGIYQAYVPVTIALYVLLLIKQLLSEDVKTGRVVLRGIYDCVSLLLGLVIYFVVLQLFLIRFNADLLPYQGINDMGNISLTQLPSMIKQAFLGGCLFPITNYASLAQIGLLKIAYCVLWAIIIVMLVYIAVAKKKNLHQVLLLVLLCLVFPVAVNFFPIMCPNSSVYTLMVYAFALVPCIPLLFMDTFPKATGMWKTFQRSFTVFCVCIILLITICNAYMTNVNYTASYYGTRQAENYVNSFVTQVRMTEGFTPDKKWALVGNIYDPLFDGTWDNVPIYGGNTHGSRLISSYGFGSWVRLYSGYIPAWASEEECSMLAQYDTVREMPIWPSEGSIQVIDEYVVIKFE